MFRNQENLFFLSHRFPFTLPSTIFCKRLDSNYVDKIFKILAFHSDKKLSIFVDWLEDSFIFKEIFNILQ